MKSNMQEQKKWKTQVLFLRKNSGIKFTTTLTDLNNTSFALTHLPSGIP